MSDRLLIRLAADSSLSWLALGADGRALSGSRSGSPPAGALATARWVMALVPGEDVLVLDAPAPTRQRAQLARAVPFAVEDQLAAPVEELHFALASEVEDGRIGVAVVARTTLARWLEILAAGGIRPDVLLPDTLALGAGTVLVESSRALARPVRWRAAVVDTPGFADWLGLFGADWPAPAVVDTREAPRLALPVEVAEYRERARDPLALLAAGAHAPPLNLLQGEFAPQHRRGGLQRLWRIAAVLAGAVVALGLMQLVVEGALLRRESARLDTAMRDQLMQSFPEMEKVSGPPAALMRSAVQRLGGDTDAGGLIATLGRIAPILGGTTRLVTRGLEWRNGTLEFAVTAPDVPTLDALRERLATVPGLHVELTAANPVKDGVDGRLRLGGVP